MIISGLHSHFQEDRGRQSARSALFHHAAVGKNFIQSSPSHKKHQEASDWSKLILLHAVTKLIDKNYWMLEVWTDPNPRRTGGDLNKLHVLLNQGHGFRSDLCWA